MSTIVYLSRGTVSYGVGTWPSRSFWMVPGMVDSSLESMSRDRARHLLDTLSDVAWRLLTAAERAAISVAALQDDNGEVQVDACTFNAMRKGD